MLADGDVTKCLNEARNSALAKSQAHFTIGMLRLAERDRDGAYEQFKLSVATNAVATYGYELRVHSSSGWRVIADGQAGLQVGRSVPPNEHTRTSVS